jgi:ComF family protein
MVPSLLDMVFPRVSLGGAEGALVSDAEVLQLQQQCHSGGFPVQVDGLECVIAAASYDDAPLVRKAVHTLKYKRIPAVYHALALAMDHALPVASTDATVLCPVPLHWTRRFWRGFNQAELLAEALGHYRHMPVCSVLKRRRPTGRQARRGRKDRLVAMQDAFAARTGFAVPKTVILIDDVVTTGATLSACAAALRAAGAQSVSAWVVARA